MRILLALLLIGASALGQEAETRARWQYFQELGAAPTGQATIELDREALGGARPDLADLRLYDQAGREVPYALRIRRKVHRSEVIEAKQLDRGVRDERTQVTLDLGDYSGVHNEIELDLAGQNFRRRVEVQGSDDAANWATLTDNALVFRFASAGRSVDQRTVAYPDSRYRYLRVLVSPDPGVDSMAPALSEVRARLRVETEGVERLYPSAYPVREPTRQDNRAASSYDFSISAGAIPVESLKLELSQAPFSRPYRLLSGDERNNREIASGTLASDAEGSTTVTVRFEEAPVKQLRLVVTDDRNPPLEIYSAQPAGAARQLLFQNDGLAYPLRLYYGNPDAASPNYDYDQQGPETLQDAPPPLPLEPRQLNPDYRAPELPVSERAPWLIYVVLAAAALALLWLLRGVVRDAGASA
jgi:hypothetical protein